MDRRLEPFVKWFQRRVNPVMRAALERGLPVPGVALLETTGRRSGLPRRTPVANGLVGGTFWVIVERSGAQYVQNVKADPRVRVKVGGRWRTGRAEVLAGEDPRRIARLVPGRLPARSAWMLATDPLVIRIDLDEPFSTG
jgi:deazaflavin-dependent oxidoreductase (nitroreductase family)